MPAARSDNIGQPNDAYKHVNLVAHLVLCFDSSCTARWVSQRALGSGTDYAMLNSALMPRESGFPQSLAGPKIEVRNRNGGFRRQLILRYAAYVELCDATGTDQCCSSRSTFPLQVAHAAGRHSS